MGHLFNDLNSISENPKPTKRNDKNFNYIVENAFKFANCHFQKRYQKVNFIKNFMNCELADLAIDSIAHLFIKNGYDEYPIIKSFREWTPKIKNERDAFHFLNKLVACSVEQYIIKLLRKVDPHYSKILDASNYQIKKNYLSKFKFLGVTYFSYSDFDEMNSRLITDNQIEDIPNHIVFRNGEFCLNTLDYLRDEIEGLPAIPLKALIHKIKNEKVLEFSSYNKAENIEMSIDVDEIVEVSLAEALTKLNSSYYQKNKLDDSEFELFKNILYDISIDIKNGGVNPGFYKYFQKYNQTISKDEYQEKYHNIIEYLFKILRKSIISKIT